MNLRIIGWREWISLPALKISRIKVKVDTGARTSSLHAWDLKIKKKKGKNYACFYIHPEQRSNLREVYAEAEVIEMRKVKSSNGKSELRPVIHIEIQIDGDIYSVEVTLTNRDMMGFRMLLGRQALKKRYVVNSAVSYQTDFSKKIQKKLRSLN
jgi:hypothetical protein